MLAAGLLLLMAAAYLAFIRGDLQQWRMLRRFGAGEARAARYRLLVLKDLLGFGAPALLVLVALGREDALVRMPAVFAPLAAHVEPIDFAHDRFLLGMVLGAAAVGTVIGTTLALLARRRGKRPPMLGDVGSLLPERRGELLWGALLSLTAGVTEELFFRLALPLLLTLLTGDALIAVAVATILFGVAHRYQGWIGIVATTLVGALFTYLYVATQSLWTVMTFHVLIDVNGLVVRPAVAGAWRR